MEESALQQTSRLRDERVRAEEAERHASREDKGLQEELAPITAKFVQLAAALPTEPLVALRKPDFTPRAASPAAPTSKGWIRRLLGPPSALPQPPAPAPKKTPLPIVAQGWQLYPGGGLQAQRLTKDVYLSSDAGEGPAKRIVGWIGHRLVVSTDGRLAFAFRFADDSIVPVEQMRNDGEIVGVLIVEFDDWSAPKIQQQGDFDGFERARLIDRAGLLARLGIGGPQRPEADEFGRLDLQQLALYPQWLVEFRSQAAAYLERACARTLAMHGLDWA